MMDKQLEDEALQRLNAAFTHIAEMVGQTSMEKWRVKMLEHSLVGRELNLALAVHAAEEEARKLQHCYRTGYVDGWIAGIGAMFDSMQVGAGGQEAHAACYDHWEKHLTEWANSRDTIATLPPSME